MAEVLPFSSGENYVDRTRAVASGPAGPIGAITSAAAAVFAGGLLVSAITNLLA